MENPGFAGRGGRKRGGRKADTPRPDHDVVKDTPGEAPDHSSEHLAGKADGPKAKDDTSLWDVLAGPPSSELRGLGLGPQWQFSDEGSAPPVDLEILRRLARGLLDPGAGDRVTRLIASYRSWAEAYGGVLRKEYEQGRPGRDREGPDGTGGPPEQEG